MIKGIIIFLGFWVIVTGSLGIWRQMSGKERWSLFKTCTYGTLTAIITFVILGLIVFLF